MRYFSTRTPISGILRRPEDRPGLGHLSSVRWSLLLVALALSVIGAATIRSASAEMPVDYLPRQAVWIALGVILAALVFSIDYQRLASLSWIFYLGSLGLLVLVLQLGEVRDGSQRWLALGPFNLQPSEIAKLTTVLVMARFLAGHQGDYLRLRELAVCGLIVAPPMLLIALQPDLGGALMFVPIALVMPVVAGVRPRMLLVLACLGLVALGAVWSFGMHDYQRARVATFLDPDSDPLGAGYQVRQSKIAVGSGELLGMGYMQGTQSQLRFLPVRHTDFIFAVLAEEWGFLGVSFVLALYAVFLFGCAEVASRARDRLGILVVMGLFSVLGFHILYNTAMVIGLLPITGIPLPFLSYGGSFMLFSFLATGIILGVDFRRYVNR
jgi:rod shape determining protein RodA